MPAARTKGFTGSRRTRNEGESKLHELAEAHGIQLSRRGYPDYAVIRGGEIIGFIEVKSKPSHRLRIAQDAFRRLCERHGIRFCRWSPAEPLPSWFWKMSENSPDRGLRVKLPYSQYS